MQMSKGYDFLHNFQEKSHVSSAIFPLLRCDSSKFIKWKSYILSTLVVVDTRALLIRGYCGIVDLTD